MPGKVVPLLTQMLDTLPVVGAMQAHFINLPEIQMNLTGAAAMAQLPPAEQDGASDWPYV